MEKFRPTLILDRRLKDSLADPKTDRGDASVGNIAADCCAAVRNMLQRNCEVWGQPV